MTRKDLADFMYKDVTKTVYDYEKIYKKRDTNGIVTRFAPSPTGFVHMGSLLTAFIAKKVTVDTNGIFYLRIEDTDNKRLVDNGINGIISDLKKYDISIDEGVISENEEVGEYGPYIQSKRIDIYNTYIKHLIENDYAYPCFCTSEELDNIRSGQEDRKEKVGYYGKYAKCRELPIEEVMKRIKNGERYVIRIKSRGQEGSKIVLNDLVRGKIEFQENDIDHIIVKSNGIPVYHFAHVIDDHLMRTTHVLRGEEWLSSVPLHIELFKMLNFEIPKYAHLGLVMKIDENGVRRKLSKRLDPEASLSYYHTKGIPVEAVKLYLLTIANSNFEEWYNCNKDKDINSFKFDFKKVSESGTLFDIEKLMNISKNYLSRLSCDEVYEGLSAYTKEYDYPFYLELTKNPEYSKRVLNIERERKNPRKDYSSYSEIFGYVNYMYSKYFDYTYNNVDDLVKFNYELLKDYIVKYFDITSEEEWYNKVKEISGIYNYSVNVKDYKLEPDKYNGHIGNVCEMIRVIVTGRTVSPSLYEILRVLGKEEVIKRFNMFLERQASK